MGSEIDVDRELDAVAAKVERTADDAAGRVAGPVTGQASSPDGGVTVTVRPGGMLSEVALTPAALRAGAEALAAQITHLAGLATRRAGATMHATLAPVLGPEGERHLASLGYQPLDDDEDETYDSPLGPRTRRTGP
ncbi:hypothetical protein [Actinokineospora bangkokensis]|uniref:YbaB/EbfC family DNA-binding protein n=1 Tax=Actinokineospora bangkokensis TaxID=1193682 RepID=A0A1Q9LER0_9PSEU|nr:hypothetical protein [Actinokineospora bangkokensis]OLR90505.1 hypothetical protein BJP25_28140 [Actinokineospora bangkokensis]